jgi:hypothetical protein
MNTTMLHEVGKERMFSRATMAAALLIAAAAQPTHSADKAKTDR